MATRLLTRPSVDLTHRINELKCYTVYTCQHLNVELELASEIVNTEGCSVPCVFDTERQVHRRSTLRSSII